MTQGQICVILQKVSDSQNGKADLNSRIVQEMIADLILAELEKEHPGGTEDMNLQS